MSEKKAKKAVKDTRIPAQELLLKFLKDQGLVLIADEQNVMSTVVQDVVYTVNKNPRIRVYYADQIKAQEKPNGKTPVNLVN